MSTLKLETYIPKAGVNKPKSRMGLAWDRLTKPVEEPPYRPLPEYYIRVAKIKPGTKDHPLRVKLKHIDPRTTKYVALSYTWDQDPSPLTGSTTNSSSDSQSTLPTTSVPDKPKMTTLLCGGTPFRVRQNLYDALCQIRDVQCDVPIFVDALCINFNDNAERTSYLEIMGHIYSRAASVIVYLGPKSSHTDSILRIMRQLVNAINWRRIGNPFTRDSNLTATYNFRDPRFFQNLGMQPLSLKQWRAIHDFCHMRWFTRYWSFFELALAKNALFLWGESCMDYNFLIDFSMILSLSGWLDEFQQISTDNLSSSTFDSETDVGLIKMFVPVAQLRSSPPWSPKHKDYATWMHKNHGLDSETAQAWQFFEILLQYAEPFECYNPRDKVYAPLALARAAFGGTPTNKIWPTPDYSKSVAEVYADFAGPIARHTRNASIITGMEGFEGFNVGNGAGTTNENRNTDTNRLQSRTENRNGNNMNGNRNADVNRIESRTGSRNGNMNVDGNVHANRNPNESRSGSRNRNMTNENRNADANRTESRTGSRNANVNSNISENRNTNENRHVDVNRTESRTGSRNGNVNVNGNINGNRNMNESETGSMIRNGVGNSSKPASRSSSKNRSENNNRPQSRNGKLISKRARNRNG